MGQRLIITITGKLNEHDKADLELNRIRESGLVEFGEDQMILANCYYHWGAFTYDATTLTLQVMQEIRRLASVYDIRGEVTATQQLTLALMTFINTGATFPDTDTPDNVIELLEQLKGFAALPITSDSKNSQMYQKDISLLDELIHRLETEKLSGDRNNGLIGVSNYGVRDNQEWSEGDVYIDSTDPLDPTCNFGVISEVNPEELDDDDLEDLRNAIRLPVDPWDDYFNEEALRKFSDSLDGARFYKFLYTNGTNWYERI